jgi:hypothetical protein
VHSSAVFRLTTVSTRRQAVKWQVVYLLARTCDMQPRQCHYSPSVSIRTVYANPASLSSRMQGPQKIRWCPRCCSASTERTCCCLCNLAYICALALLKSIDFTLNVSSFCGPALQCQSSWLPPISIEVAARNFSQHDCAFQQKVCK